MPPGNAANQKRDTLGAFARRVLLVVAILALALLVQRLENRLIVPLVQWKAVALPPAVVILAAVALGLLFGLRACLWLRR